MPSDVYKSADRYGIIEGRRGFQVTIGRGGRQWRKTFAFALWGGREAALQQAQLWRDDVVRRHPPRSRRAKAQALIATNTSGVSGVSAKRTPEGEVWLWTAKTEIDRGQVLTKSFSVGRYGQEARGMAIAERQRQLRQLRGPVQVHPAEAVVRTREPAPRAAVARPLSRVEVLRRNNTSGVPGVLWLRGNPPHPGWWLACTEHRGQKLRKSFSIKMHGQEQAKAMAVAERERQLRQVGGAPRQKR